MKTQSKSTLQLLALYTEDDDAILASIASDNSSTFGGAGDDTITMRGLQANSATFVKGNSGDDLIRASDEDDNSIASTIYGGQGNDTITQGIADDGTVSKDDYNMYFYGDKGDDVLSSSDQEGIFRWSW